MILSKKENRFDKKKGCRIFSYQFFPTRSFPPIFSMKSWKKSQKSWKKSHFSKKTCFRLAWVSAQVQNMSNSFKLFFQSFLEIEERRTQSLLEMEERRTQLLFDMEERRVRLEEQRLQIEERRSQSLLQLEERRSQFLVELEERRLLIMENRPEIEVLAARKRLDRPRSDFETALKRKLPQTTHSESETETDFSPLSPHLESEEPSFSIESNTSLQLTSHSSSSDQPQDSDWFKFPDGNHVFSLPATSYDQVESTGYAWNHLWQKGSRRTGTFAYKRKCAGVLVCSATCGYLQRPYVTPKTQYMPKSKRRYHEKEYRQFCRGSCAEAGRLTVSLVLIPCDCVLFYRCTAKTNQLEVEHRGTNDHPRPPLSRATSAELHTYEDEAIKNIRITPKKKPSQLMHGRSPIRMPTLSLNDSGGLELRRHATWNRS